MFQVFDVKHVIGLALRYITAPRNDRQHLLEHMPKRPCTIKNKYFNKVLTIMVDISPSYG